jgi:hypothetical protein
MAVLEHFHKYCSDAVGKDRANVMKAEDGRRRTESREERVASGKWKMEFRGQESQGTKTMLLYSASPKHQKSSLRMATVFLQTL